MRHAIAVTVAVVALAACGRAPSAPRARASTAATSAEPATSSARTPPDPKWKDHVGDIPFVVGQEAGMRLASASGRTPMYFFTATW
jgi:hypothetical protein